MPSSFLNQALDGTDIGYNKAIVDALMVVAQGGDRRTLVYQNPTGSYSYLGVARAAFPRTYLNTDTMPVCTGVVRNAVNDAQLQAAITAANANAALGLHDWIVAALGTYTGTYTFAGKQGDTAPGGNGVLVIISKAVYDSIDPVTGIAAVCPAKKRVSAADVVASMPYFKCIALDNTHQWSFDGDTRGYRIIGLRFGADATVTALGRLVRVGNGDGDFQNGPTTTPQNVIFDRCGFDFNATGNLKAALELHGRSVGVQDSWFGDEIHHDGQDCKAIFSCNGPGPVRVVNNRLCASTENILIGGAYSTPGCAPQDWEVRWNRFEKNLKWNPSHPTYAGKKWAVKNLFEAKKLQYGLIEGNYMHDMWPEDQEGDAFLIKSESYGDGPVNGYSHDIIVRWNLSEDVGAAIRIAGQDAVELRTAIKNVWSIGNLYKIGAQYFDASSNSYFGYGLFENCGTIHDTFVGIGSVNAIGQPEGGQTGLTHLDTIFGLNTYGLKGSGQSEGLPTLAAFCPGYDLRRNLFVGRESSLYPPNNFFPADVPQVQFTNPGAGDFSLLGSSQVLVPTDPPVVAPVLDHFQLVVAPSATGTSGVPLARQPSVKAIDDSGTQFVLNGTLAISVLSGNATIAAGGTITMTNGLGTAVGLTLTAAAPTIVVLRITHAASGLHVDTPAIAIDAPMLTVTTAASDGVSGVVLPTQPRVQYRDAAGVAIARAGVVLTATVPDNNGSVSAGGTAITDAAGLATFSGLTLSVLSERDVTLRYSTSGAAPVDETVHVTMPASNPAVAALVCTRQPKGAKNGEPLRVEPRYEWQDGSGHVVTTETAPVHLSVVGNATTFGTDTLAAVGGVVDFAGSGFGVNGRGKITIIAEGTP